MLADDITKAVIEYLFSISDDGEEREVVEREIRLRVEAVIDNSFSPGSYAEQKEARRAT